jgi:hypothetical protein
MSNRYSQVRFIGYTIPTTPANMVAIGNPNGPGAVAGTYLGLSDFAQDVAARVAVLKNAVDVAKAALPGDTPGSVLNVFVAPEFYFHGVQGPYLYSDDAEDPIPVIMQQLLAALPPADYPDWSFVCGSAITARIANPDRLFAADSVSVRNAVVEALSKQWLAAFGPLSDVIFDMLVNFIKNCHAYPAVEVRNRALLVSGVPLDTPAAPLGVSDMTTEKYFDSNEDFILYDVSGNTSVVTEQMTAYPQIDLSNGDLKTRQYDKHAIFRQNYGAGNFPDYVDFGVEICLDHSDSRLRSNIDNEPFPKSTDAMHVQIIPSCGMQIQLPGVAADTHGFVFNCDGQYAVDTTVGTAQQGNLNGVQCIYANYVDSANASYAGHTQLARVQAPATGGDPDAPSSTNATFETLDPSAITILPVPAISQLASCFAGGPGAVHIYGLNTPYAMYP